MFNTWGFIVAFSNGVGRKLFRRRWTFTLGTYALSKKKLQYGLGELPVSSLLKQVRALLQMVSEMSRRSFKSYNPDKMGRINCTNKQRSTFNNED